MITQRQQKQSEVVSELACSFFNVTPDEIDGKRKQAHYVRARHSRVWVLIKLFRWRSADCTNAFGINHKTVNHIMNKLDSIYAGRAVMKQSPLHKEDLHEFINRVEGDNRI